MKKRLSIAVLLCGLGAGPISAQVAVSSSPVVNGPSPVVSGPSPVVMSVVPVAFASTPIVTAVGSPQPPAFQPLAPDKLDDLLGPIALYPDPVISEILPAATFPSQIVMADRYISGGGDPNTVTQQPWDPSVQALAHYPTLLQWMDDNIDWTTMLGDAFMNQQQDVLDSIQRLRRDAYNRGNLQSTGGQQVVDDGNDIEIVPADGNTVYLPDYQADYSCYRPGFPVVYATPVSIGPWVNREFDWFGRRLVFLDRKHPRPHESRRDASDHRGGLLAGHTDVWKHPAAGPVSSANGRGRSWNNQSQEFNRPAAGRNFTKALPVRVQQSPPTVASTRVPVTRGWSVEEVRPQSSPVEHYRASQSASSGAGVSIENSHDTTTYSDGDEQDMHTVSSSESPSLPARAPAPAPVSAAAPPMSGRPAGMR